MAAAPAVWTGREPYLFTVKESSQFAVTWRAWRPRLLELRDGMLVYRKGEVVKGSIDMRGKVTVTRMGISGPGVDLSKVENEVGLDVLANAVAWRVIMPESATHSFYQAIKSLASEHNIDELQRDEYRRAISTELTMTHVEEGGASSVMRRAVARAFRKYDTRSRKQQVVARRGALKWLPVLFSNDLVHGSWWFVAGSVYVVISSGIVLANGFDARLLGDDSSGLSDFHYRATWFLVLVSGLMFTLGSLAFVRAMHDPPIAPWLPGWHHLQNDELIGSWFFLLGVLPLPPYCLIFLVEAESRALRLLYLAGVFFSALVMVGAYLFVRSCYPSVPGQSKAKCKLPDGLWVTTARCCLAPCLCLRERNIEFHLANDWLAGCWLLLWITLVLTAGCLALLVQALGQHDALLIFIYATSFSENVFFSLGCAYFVAGSYPSGPPPDDDDEGEGEGGGGGVGTGSDATYLPLHTQHGVGGGPGGGVGGGALAGTEAGVGAGSSVLV